MRFLLPLTLCVTMATAHAQTAQKRVLPNGLTVIARENRAAPVVAVRIYVRTGSITKSRCSVRAFLTLFEHTLFEGTKSRDKVALNDEIQAIGGQSNAYTSYDVTGVSRHHGQAVFRACRRGFERHDAQFHLSRKRGESAARRHSQRDEPRRRRPQPQTVRVVEQNRVQNASGEIPDHRFP
jgi:hypothetical protein